LLWKSGELQLTSLNKIISAYEYFTKTKFLQKLFDEITEIRSIDAELKQSKENLLSEASRVEKKMIAYESEKRESKISGEHRNILEEKFNEKQKQITQMEAEIKNMMKSLDSYEKDLGNIEVSKKENNAKLAKLVQWIEFSNTTLKTYESTLKEKKAQWEEVKRNLQGAKVDNFEEAGEAVGKQLEQAEKKYQENQNYIVRLKQKVSQIKEQLEMEKGMVDNSLNSRYFFFL